MNKLVKHRLKEARSDAFFTQKEVAQKLGISQVAVAKYETGVCKPNIDTLTDLCKLYHTTPNYIMGFD